MIIELLLLSLLHLLHHLTFVVETGHSAVASFVGAIESTPCISLAESLFSWKLG